MVWAHDHSVHSWILMVGSPLVSCCLYCQLSNKFSKIRRRIKKLLWLVWRRRMSHSLALGAVAVHAVLYRLVARLADGATRHLHGQTRLRAPLDASFELPALCVDC